MKQRLLFACLVIVLVFGLIGCGGGNDNANNLDGRWERSDGHPRSYFVYEFQGRNFTYTHEEVGSGGVRQVAHTNNGTFSISGDYIEFVFEDGRIMVSSFSRTENTISIDGRRYTRASGSGSAAPEPAVPASAAPAQPAPAPAAPAQPAPAPAQPVPAPVQPAAPTTPPQHTNINDPYGLNGRWEAQDGIGFDDEIWVEFEGDRFILPNGAFGSVHGTFSISGNQIEFLTEKMGADGIYYVFEEIARAEYYGDRNFWFCLDSGSTLFPRTLRHTFSRIDENTFDMFEGIRFIRVG